MKGNPFTHFQNVRKIDQTYNEFEKKLVKNKKLMLARTASPNKARVMKSDVIKKPTVWQSSWISLQNM